MTTRWTWTWMVAVSLLGLVVARQGWAACCKCLQCDSAVLCFTGGGNAGDCFETCSGINTCPCTNLQTCPLVFDAMATCGENGFADCTAINNVPVATPTPGVTAAPILGSPTSPWFVLATLALLLTGAALLFRSARRES